ncbi:PDZ domain-containing protein [Hymenobacter taeanensis]|uniref:PDZ domain-containing protein n=1 Tax=Hymenobacter taeanensis TaxID=2735321 RepID=A0A6M6BC77_9BACT|nr:MULTISPECIES: aspartyl protease family protein [Hymenobacter]QJX45424.1 PDZ domain-containing protein [Hymenobacter taeanensis]UOQ81331.1 aspartyl protease family protein [Hymenobacter sp. 5414T-23]
MQRNLVVIPLRLNGQGPFNFLLDTGINTSLITDATLRQQLHLRTKQRFLIAGAGEEEPLEGFLVDSMRVELTGLHCASLPMLLLSNDVLNLSGYVGMPIHGLLGADIFRSFVVEIRPQEQEVVFRNPETYQAPRGRRWARIPLDIEGNKTYVTLPVTLNDSLTLPLKLVLDTGAGHALSLETTSNDQLKLPAQHLRTQLGRGLNGYINGYLGRITALRIGRYRVPSLLTSFPDAADVAQRADVFRNGNLGFELLKRFVVIIDYTHNRLLLRPNSTFRQPFEHDMSGFDLVAAGPELRRYVVGKIQPDSPAEVAGLETNDELVSINLVPTAQMNMTQINNMFRSYHNRMLLLVLRRPSGKLYTTAIRLQRQI